MVSHYLKIFLNKDVAPRYGKRMNMTSYCLKNVCKLCYLILEESLKAHAQV